MYLCGFWYVRMFVARANKVEGTMSWCLGTSEILASIEQGHLETAILILHNFFVFYYGSVQVFGSITLKIFMIQTQCTVVQLFKGSYFSVDAASRHFNARIYEFCFTCFNWVEYKRSYIFKALPTISNNWYLDMDFNSKVCAL